MLKQATLPSSPVFQRPEAVPRAKIEQFDTLIRRDPARRGLIATQETHGRLCPGHLFEAASHLARHGSYVAIVTGFYIPCANPPAAETDGPLGAAFLAAALRASGINAKIVTDPPCLPAVTAAAAANGLPRGTVLSLDDHGRESFFTTSPGSELSHLIAVERAGPSHTPETVSAQHSDSDGVDHSQRFSATVPAQNHNRCHNMRGQIIDEHTTGLHTLFEQLTDHKPLAKTIGIGDGGNEIGMGAIPWDDLSRRIAGEHAATIPCRVATDWTIIGGTSNWGAYALAAATLFIRREAQHLESFTSQRELTVLQQTVRHGPAVDGITLRAEPTVDSLPFETYIQPWEGMRALLDF